MPLDPPAGSEKGNSFVVHTGPPTACAAAATTAPNTSAVSRPATVSLIRDILATDLLLLLITNYRAIRVFIVRATPTRVLQRDRGSTVEFPPPPPHMQRLNGSIASRLVPGSVERKKRFLSTAPRRVGDQPGQWPPRVLAGWGRRRRTRPVNTSAPWTSTRGAQPPRLAGCHDQVHPHNHPAARDLRLGAAHDARHRSPEALCRRSASSRRARSPPCSRSRRSSSPERGPLHSRR